MMHGSILDFIGACVWTPFALRFWWEMLTDRVENCSLGIVVVLIFTVPAAYCIGRLIGLPAV